MNILDLRPQHLDLIQVQPRQTLGPTSWYLSSDPGYAVIDGGHVYAVCGFTRRARPWDPCEMWSLLSIRARERMLALTRIGDRMVELHGGLVMMHVHRGFEEAHRWARLLKFEPFVTLDTGDFLYRRFA